MPELYWIKVLVWEGAFKLALAVLIALAIRRIANPFDQLLCTVALVVPAVGNDAYYFIGLLAAGAWIHARGQGGLVLQLGVLLLVAALTQVKFTYAIAALVLVAGIAASTWTARGPRAALALVASAIVAFVGLWIALGQDVSNLPRWVRTTLWISSGYNESMGIIGSGTELGIALAMLALLAVLAWPRLVGLRAVPAQRGFVLGVLAVFFVAYKAGFVRHLVNSSTFFDTAAVGVFFVFATRREAARAARTRSWLARGVLVLGLVGHALSEDLGLDAPWTMPRSAVARAGVRLDTLAHPFRTRDELESQLAQARAKWNLPRVLATVGRDPIDQVTASQGVLFLNDLTYRPRPVFQSYSAYTAPLQEENARFLAGDRAPRWVLLGAGEIDRRLPGMDDALALQVLMRDYATKLTERGFLLLERAPRGPAPAGTRATVLERDVRFDEEVDVGALDGRCLLLQAEIAPSLLGRLVSLAWKTTPLFLRVRTDSGEEREFRIAPGGLVHGAPIVPFLDTQAAWVRWFDGVATKRVTRFSVRCTERCAPLWQPTIRVRVVRADDLVPQRGPGLSAPAGLSGAVPAEISAAVEPYTRVLRGAADVLVVEAPSFLRYPLPAGPHSLRAECGLLPSVWEPDPSGRIGASDGARFSAVLRRADGTETVLDSIFLDPVHVAGDRALRVLSAQFETGEGCELLLRTDVGPNGDARRDWTYWKSVALDGTR